jgi:cysteinyl-tRNA synthetase
MSAAHLGEIIDIHAGGQDLVFPHHENEIAQSRCAHPTGQFARYWLHNEMLQVEGKKMSKSLGNFFTVRDLLDGNWSGGWKVPGEVIRFVILSTHYGKPMDWTEEKAQEARTVLRRWRELTKNVEPSDIAPVVLQVLSDDLNTPAAIAELHRLAASGEANVLISAANLLGLLERGRDVALCGELLPPELSKRIDHLVDLRLKARAEKDWARSDLIRGFLNIAGVVIEDGQAKPWRLGFDHEPFGWLAVARAAMDNKSVTPISEISALAATRGLEYELDKRGYWKTAGTRGEPKEFQSHFLDYAEQEAFE